MNLGYVAPLMATRWIASGLGIANFDETDGRELLLDVRITDMDGPSNLKIGAPRAIFAKHVSILLYVYIDSFIRIVLYKTVHLHPTHTYIATTSPSNRSSWWHGGFSASWQIVFPSSRRREEGKSTQKIDSSRERERQRQRRRWRADEMFPQALIPPPHCFITTNNYYNL
jgi:hypothetical protein